MGDKRLNELRQGIEAGGGGNARRQTEREVRVDDGSVGEQGWAAETGFHGMLG